MTRFTTDIYLFSKKCYIDPHDIDFLCCSDSIVFSAFPVTELFQIYGNVPLLLLRYQIISDPKRTLSY